MNAKIEQLYQRIGRKALDIATHVQGRLLLYSEVEPGATSADLFYVEAGNEKIRFRFAPELHDAVYSLWNEWRRHPGNQEWRALSYVIDDGKFSIDFTYLDQLDPTQSLSDRRPLAVARYFGDVEVDYSEA